MKWLADSTNWIATQYPGIGVPANLIASNGTDGPGFLYITLDAGDVAAQSELRWIPVGSIPAAFKTFEDGSFIIPAGTPDGTYQFTYRLYQDGADKGTAVVTAVLGLGTIQVTVNVVETTFDTVTAQVQVVPLPVTATVAIVETFQDVFSGRAFNVETATVSIVEFFQDTFSAQVSLGITATVAITESFQDTFSGQVQITNPVVNVQVAIVETMRDTFAAQAELIPTGPIEVTVSIVEPMQDAVSAQVVMAGDLEFPSGIYANIHASILRYISNFGAVHSMVPKNFDDSWDEAELPNANVVGMLGLNIDVEDHFVTGSVQCGISTWEDTNLMLMTRYIDRMLTDLLPTKSLAVYSADTGEKMGLMKVLTGTKVMPVIGSKTRPLQMIAFTFQTTSTYTLND